MRTIEQAEADEYLYMVLCAIGEPGFTCNFKLSLDGSTVSGATNS